MTWLIGDQIFQYDQRLTPGTMVIETEGWLYVVISNTSDKLVFLQYDPIAFETLIIIFWRIHLRNLPIFVHVLGVVPA